VLMEAGAADSVFAKGSAAIRRGRSHS
jgi:hypothetical protein